MPDNCEAPGCGKPKWAFFRFCAECAVAHPGWPALWQEIEQIEILGPPLDLSVEDDEHDEGGGLIDVEYEEEEKAN